MAASVIEITVPAPVPGQSPFRRGYHPNILTASYIPRIKFGKPKGYIDGWWRLIHIGFFFLNSAAVANRAYGIEPVMINDTPAGDCALGGILTKDTTAGQWGKVTLTAQGLMSTDMKILNHNVGGLAQINSNMIFSGNDYISCIGYNAQAGDYFNIGYTFEFLNNIYGIRRPG